MRAGIVLTAIICAPIMLYSYGLFGVMAVKIWGWWSVPVIASHLVVWATIASLIDMLKERQP